MQDTTTGGTSAQLPAANAAVGANSSAAIAADILREIKSDPKITSKDIQVTFEPKTPTFAYDLIHLTGTVATDDERVAAVNHARATAASSW